jgi:hypothetical protein
MKRVRCIDCKHCVFMKNIHYCTCNTYKFGFLKMLNFDHVTGTALCDCMNTNGKCKGFEQQKGE